jgi:co-chaperonin GroES (HSP10)
MPRVNPTKILLEDIPELESKSKGGIILPDAVLKKVVMKGKIVIVGDGTPDIPMTHKVGDIAIYHPRAGTTFVYDDKEYRLIDSNEVLLSGV